MDPIWQRVTEGTSIVCVGPPPGAEPLEFGARVVRVSCLGPSGPLGPIVDGVRAVEGLLGPESDPAFHWPVSVPIGLRGRLLGEDDWQDPCAPHVEALNRLADAGEGRCALVVEHIEAADPMTIDLLRRVVRRAGWLRVPLVLHYGDASGDGPPYVLLQELAESRFAVIEPTADEDAEAVVLAPVAGPREEALDLRGLEPRDIRVLRACALVGPTFEVELVGAMLEMQPVDVLEALQRAWDVGLPLDDRGGGRMRLPAAVAEALTRGLLPSLASQWHRRAAELLHVGRRGDDVAALEADIEDVVGPVLELVSPLDHEDADDLLLEDLFRSTAASATGSRPGEEPAANEDRPSYERAEAGARAGRHLEQAGAYRNAVDRYLSAARDANAAGAVVMAVEYATSAMALLDRLPETNTNRRLRVAALTELGRVQWQAVGPEEDFSLAGALETLLEARDTLRPGDPAELSAALRHAIATVLFDMGDMDALEKALDELTEASRDFMRVGDALGAARLLNDQAAVYVRLGDPVRANGLLQESRKVFESHAAEDPVAMAELAQTDLLIARLPLHVAARPGREHDAIEMAVSHARAAEKAFRQLRAPRDIGRAWETLGRLAVLAGDADGATRMLARATELQHRIDDAMGLARSTAAQAEVLTAAGRFDEALALLGESMALNRAKGSPLGLAYNRAALETITEVAPETGTILQTVRSLRSELERAEEYVGKVPLPPVWHP